MKRYTLEEAVERKNHYKATLIGSMLSDDLSIKIIDIIACIEGQQENFAKNNLSIEIYDTSYNEDQRLMKIFAVYAYGVNKNDEFIFKEVDEFPISA